MRGRRAGSDVAWTVGIAFVARLVVLLWSRDRFPPAADGIYYETIARRIADGFGYTWRWPDGAVTYAAHYPVGYPAMVGAAYAISGKVTDGSLPIASWVNSLFGVAMAASIHLGVRPHVARTTSRFVGLAVALHPALLMYTPAVMTEGVTAAIWSIGALLAVRAHRAVPTTEPTQARALCWSRGWSLGLAIGAATLVRPQSLALAPVWGWLAAPRSAGPRQRFRLAGLVTLIALGVCLPWTIRNFERMHSCALVSVNGGWNLLIGTDPTARGAWAPVDVPEACKNVWDEAGKDACFGRVARARILASPALWIRGAPAKLARTFDYCGGAGYYLHASNPALFDDHAKWWLAVVETIFVRVTYAGALIWGGLRSGPARRLRPWLALFAGAFLFGEHAYVAIVLLLVIAIVGTRPPAAWRDEGGESEGTMGAIAMSAIALTAFTHAVFFGAGRYSMVVFPLLVALAGMGCELLFRAWTHCKRGSL